MNWTRWYYIGLSFIATALVLYVGHGTGDAHIGNARWWITVAVTWYTMQPMFFGVKDLLEWRRQRRKARATPDLYTLIDNKVVSE